ncbi:MAG TPA: hypothetical protein VEA38_01590 [Terriglobales bacterium]|nr:hypothetical protein [Terriglobales bacterium]
MVELAKKLVTSKWGVAALFGGAAVLVGAGYVPHDDPQVQTAAGVLAGVVGAGVAIVGQALIARFTNPKPPVQ